jgi:hypothetical protein
MKGKKALRFVADVYQQEFFFLKYWSREDFEIALGVDSINSGAMTVLKNGIIYIWVDSIKGEGVSHLAHECCHAANFTLGTRGIKISTKNDEAHAYLTQWIFYQCYKSLRGPKL